MTLLPVVVLLAGALAFLAGRIGTQLSIAIAHRRAILAHANERTSHTHPTPRLGGIGIALGVAIPVAAIFAFRSAMPEDVYGPLFESVGKIPARLWIAAAACCTVAFAVGLADDMMDLKPVPKLAGQMLAAAFAALGGLHPTPDKMVLFDAHPNVAGATRITVELSPSVGAVLAFLFILLMINVINFIDGINGLAARLCQIPLLALLIAIPVERIGGLAILLGCIVALLAIEGFLGLNESTPKTFMGDSGSHFLGALVAVSLLLAYSVPAIPKFPVLAALALIAVPVFDVLFTLQRRTRAGIPPWKAHREHLYQRHLASTGENHTRTRLFVLAHAACGGIVGGMLLVHPEYAQGPRLIAPSAALAAILLSYWGQVRIAERSARA